MNQKGFINILIIIIGVVVLAGVVGYFVVSQRTPSPVPIPSPIPSPNLTQVPSPAPTPTPNPTPTLTPALSGETANWKTYRNEKVGFEFKHPPSMQISGSENLVMVVDQQAKQGLSILVDINGNPTETSVQSLAAEEFAGEKYSAYTRIGGVEAVSGQEGSVIMFAKGKDVYLVMSSIPWITQERLNKNLFDQILSTFKFIQ